jgi:hypothetical protein
MQWMVKMEKRADMLQWGHAFSDVVLAAEKIRPKIAVVVLARS